MKKDFKYLLLLLLIFLSSLAALVIPKKNKLKKNYLNTPANTKSKMTDSSINQQVQEETVLAAKDAPEKRTENDQQIKVANIRFGVVVKDYSNNTGQISGLENTLEKIVSTVGIYKQFGLPTNQYLVETDLAYIKNAGKILLLAWEPWNPNEGTNQSIDYLKEIAEGKHDDYITTFARQVKNYSSPVLLRFAHEMNGNWYPWGTRPSEYVSAYRRIVEVFHSQGTDNVKFVWSINHESVPYEPISQCQKYFPGEAYVDIIGIDGFNFGTSRNNSTWKSFDNIFSPAYSFVSTAYPEKPIIITEVGSTEFGGNKNKWIDEMFASLANMPKIQEIIWFNLLKETDWRIDSSTTSTEAFQRNLSTL
ncbi:glycoside hydrolase family 26 protein [Patescibacteria group bacterium]